MTNSHHPLSLTRTPPHFPFPILMSACQGKDPNPAGCPSKTLLLTPMGRPFLLLEVEAVRGLPHKGSFTTGPNSRNCKGIGARIATMDGAKISCLAKPDVIQCHPSTLRGTLSGGRDLIGVIIAWNSVSSLLRVHKFSHCKLFAGLWYDLAALP